MRSTVHPVRSVTRGPALLVLILPVAALAVAALMPSGPDTSATRARARNPARPPGQRLTVADARPILGFAINAHHISDLSLYLESVDRIAALGANALIVLSPMFQPRVDSTAIQYRPETCAAPVQLTAILRHARAQGLYTALLPVVLIENAGPKEWRGVIQPADWEAWWTSYDGFIDHFLNIAIDADADLFIIGSELNSTEDMHDRWAHVTEEVRKRFEGQIGYSANWDRYQQITFWPMVDVMCVSAYFELKRENPQASEPELVLAWEVEKLKLLDTAGKWDRPLLLSEVGYPSLPWASSHPWNYVNTEGVKADHEAQARCWRAFFTAWTDALARADSPAAGFFGHRWSPYFHGEEWDTGYGIDGKPALSVIRSGFARICSESQNDD